MLSAYNVPSLSARQGATLHSARRSSRVLRSSRVVASAKMVTVQEAAKMQKDGHMYLDVRTPQEFDAGHAPGAMNVPIMLQGPAGMSVNSQFLDAVHKQIPDKKTNLLVACKAGPRAKSAAQMLEQDGYTSLTEVEGGWMAWAGAGLPSQMRTPAE